MTRNVESDAQDANEMVCTKRAQMPRYTYSFSNCCNVIPSARCPLSVDENRSSNMSPNFGLCRTNGNDDSHRKDDTNMLNSPVCRLSVPENCTRTLNSYERDTNPVSCVFDQEDELACASAVEANSTDGDRSEENSEFLGDISNLRVDDDYPNSTKMALWCQKYVNGNMESFRNKQRELMKDIIRRNVMNDSSSDVDLGEFPMRCVYNRGKTVTDDKLDPSTLKVGDELPNKYVIEAIIGTTTFSSVVKARNKATNELVCIKISMPEYINQAIDEIILLKQLNSRDVDDTNNIVKLLDCYFYSGCVFSIMELLGENLYEVSKEFYASRKLRAQGNELKHRNGWSLDCLRLVARDILRALDFIHSFGIINCDLKPENVVLRKGECLSKAESSDPITSPVIKLIDFGSSCFIQDKLNTYVQSRSYRAPEVVLGLPYDTQIDLWSLGCLLCELYMGRILFPSDNNASLMASMISLLGVPPVYMLQYKMNSMFIILPNGKLADFNVPNHILKMTPFALRPDHPLSICCNVSDSSKCSHFAYNMTVLNQDLDNNVSSLDETHEFNNCYKCNEYGDERLNNPQDDRCNLRNNSGYVRTLNQCNSDSNCSYVNDSFNRYGRYDDNNIRLEIRNNCDNVTKLMRIIQPSICSIDTMLESNKSKDLTLFADFIKGLLHYDPIERLTTTAALAHPFITSNSTL